MHKKGDYYKPIICLIFIPVIFFISNLQARESLPARFSANAYTGVYTVGQADLMVSLDGDEQHNLYVDPQGAYGSDQQWYGDLGLGYRWIKNDAAILGAYLFAGHSRVENSSGFWIVSPGVEALGSRWDARINAYIPVGGRSNELGNVDLNIVSQPFFTGHTEVINKVFNIANEIQQIGNGADARVGYQLFHQVPLKGYVGTYFFAIPNTDNVRGGAAGLEYWIDDNIRVFANYSYDNYQHSKVVGGLGISFGGVRKHWADPSLSERLTDPVDRYLANLGHGSGIPSKTLLYGMGSGSSSVLISDSIAFFSQTGTPNAGGVGLTSANCTFENPCGPTDFSQTGVNTLNGFLSNTMFYFNGGAYPASNAGNALTLNNGQSVFSRIADYSAAATGAARSTFNGGFNLTGNNQLEGVILNNTGVSAIGVNASNAQNLLISNSQIGSAGMPYLSGLSLFESSAVLENDVIFSNLSGIQVAQNASLNIQSSEVNVSGVGNKTGISLTNNGTTIIVDSQINVLQATGGVAIGIFGSGTSTSEINDSTITVQNTGATAIGLETTGSAQIQMNAGSLLITGDATSLLTEGSNISLNLVSCTFNGGAVAC